ncbi:hypothetical protein B0H65DRAFT_417387, partial [Neurospora tetraspora]
QGIRSQNSKDTASKLRGKRVQKLDAAMGPTCAVQELDGHAKVADEASQSHYHEKVSAWKRRKLTILLRYRIVKRVRFWPV